jgi:hypothetical protein
MKKSRAAFTDRSAQVAKVGRTQVSGSPGLYLVTHASGSRRFIFRYVSPITKRPNECRIGKYPDISLKRAREIAAELRTLVAEKKDPVAWRQEQDRALEIEATTFGKAVANYETAFKARSGARNAVFLVRRHAKALLDLPIAAVNVADVRKALAGVQATYPGTAKGRWRRPPPSSITPAPWISGAATTRRRGRPSGSCGRQRRRSGTTRRWRSARCPPSTGC